MCGTNIFLIRVDRWKLDASHQTCDKWFVRCSAPFNSDNSHVMKSSEDLNLFIFQLTLTKLSHVGKRLGKKNTMTGTKLIFLKLLCIYYYRSCKFHHPSILNSEYFLFGQKIQHSIQFLRDYSEAGYQKIDNNKF